MICSPVIPVRVDAGPRIAERALSLLGFRFRLHGRNPVAGLDCIGVVAHALACTHAPRQYTLRGEYDERIYAFFDCDRFLSLSSVAPAPGDILLLRPAPRQAHLAIATASGAVHAHAGLGRVVLTPLPLPWPITGHWRFTGD